MLIRIFMVKDSVGFAANADIAEGTLERSQGRRMFSIEFYQGKTGHLLGLLGVLFVI